MDLEAHIREQAEIISGLSAALVTLTHAVSEQPGIDAAALKAALIGHYSRVAERNSSAPVQRLFQELVSATESTIRA